MRKGIISICLAIGFVIPVAAYGQQPLYPANAAQRMTSVESSQRTPVVNPAYPWRESAPVTSPMPAQQPTLRTENVQDIVPAPQNVPTPPGMDRNTLIASSRTVQDGEATQVQGQLQPHTPHAAEYNFEPAAGAPV